MSDWYKFDQLYNINVITMSPTKNIDKAVLIG